MKPRVGKLKRDASDGDISDELTKIFLSLDRQSNGFLRSNDLVEKFCDINQIYSHIHGLCGEDEFATPEELVQRFDANNDGKLNMTEFLQGMIERPKN